MLYEVITLLGAAGWARKTLSAGIQGMPAGQGGNFSVWCDLLAAKAGLGFTAGVVRNRITSYNVCYTKLLRGVGVFALTPEMIRPQ